jgi:hypothetical protein
MTRRTQMPNQWPEEDRVHIAACYVSDMFNMGARAHYYSYLPLPEGAHLPRTFQPLVHTEEQVHAHQEHINEHGNDICCYAAEPAFTVAHVEKSQTREGHGFGVTIDGRHYAVVVYPDEPRSDDALVHEAELAGIKGDAAMDWPGVKKR